MDDYSTIRIKKDVVIRFRKVALQMALVQSEALTLLINQWEKYNRNESAIERDRIIKELVPHIEKNTNRLVGILRSIEKDKINHIHGLIHALFTAGTSKTSGNLSDPKNATKPTPSKQKFEDVYTLIELRHQKTSLEWEIQEVKKDFYSLLAEKVIVVQQRFQSPRLELDIKLDELNALKSKYKPK